VSAEFQNKIPWTAVLYAAIGIWFGAATGIGLYTFIYAKGSSYLRDDPKACANCHVMNDQYNGWVKSTHHAVATCNDCHTPHNLLGKMAIKSSNGFWHSFYFTTGDFHEPIRITKLDKKIAENNCRRCHQDIVAAMDGPHRQGEKLSCVACHGSVGHP
jgi:cytochrome c nitrite reductase small subunit